MLISWMRWLITTSLGGEQSKAKKIIKLYKTRMQIEEAFHDTKNHCVGFIISESLTRNLQCLGILLLIGALATFMTWLMGILTELKQWRRQYQSNTNKTRCVLSIFFIGYQVVKENQLRLREREYEVAVSQVRDNALAQWRV